MPPSKKTKRSESSDGDQSNSNNTEATPQEYLALAEGIVSISNILSATECEEYIRKCNDENFEESKVGNSSAKKNVKNKNVRNSEQVEITDEELAKKVYEKCQDAIKKMMGCSEDIVSKFNPVKIDSNWKIYRYKRGQYFDTHIDSGRTVSGLSSFITVLIYLNDDFGGGETVFEDQNLSIDPEIGKCVLFIHQLKHSSEEITKKAKFVIKSAVLFEKNDNYEKLIREKYCSGSNNMDSSDDNVIVQVGDAQFELSTDKISNFPDSMLYTLINSQMTSDVEINKDGNRIFQFPSQDPHIFKRFILPIYNQVDYLDFPINLDPSDESKIDNEFKYWGLLSPYDTSSISKETKYSNKQESWKSTELSLISKALELNLEKQKNELEAKLAILKAIKGVQKKINFNFSYKKKYSKTYELSAKVKENLSNKYEIITLKNLYDENFFLLGADKELFETCIALFGGPDVVTAQNLNFVVESQENQEDASSVVITDHDITSKSKYDFQIHTLVSDLFDEKGIKDPNKIEEELDLCGINVNYLDLKTKASIEQTWVGEYNDEYSPSYSLFNLTGILINVKRLQENKH